MLEESIGLRVQRYKKSSEKMSMPKDIFLRPYDNLPIYGGLNKSKNTFGGFSEPRNGKIEPHRQLFIRNYR